MLLASSGSSLTNSMSLELWDVLSVTTHALLHLVIGQSHAWPIVAVMCAVCALDRDLEIHEIVAALYILRFSCNTVVLDGIVAYVPCLITAGVSAYAHLEAYLALGHVYRRAALFVTVVLAVMTRYTWNTTPEMSIGRLVVYTMLTRRARAILKQDSWDSSVQCVAVLCVPFYLLVVPVVWPVATALMDWYSNSGRSPEYRRVRMREGIIEEV